MRSGGEDAEPRVVSTALQSRADRRRLRRSPVPVPSGHGDAGSTPTIRLCRPGRERWAGDPESWAPASTSWRWSCPAGNRSSRPCWPS